MSGKVIMEKYVDPGNHVVIVYINNVPIENTLIDLGVTINVMTVITMEMLQLDGLRPTPTVLESMKKLILYPPAKPVVEYPCG
jgi:hypothetical protein